MVKDGWKKKIRLACENAGTYRPYFDSTINTLAEIMAKRDQAAKQFEASGGELVVEYTNKAGATNMMKNPLLVIWEDMNKEALAYWRDLGLTPAGLKKIDEAALKQKRAASMAEVLSDLGG